ncbi:MAG: MBL fold metallo-hydrolase [Alphaproteobacteria bacterium]
MSGKAPQFFETQESRQTEFYVRFWGVRGSIACGGPEVQRYGGNTSCMEVCCGNHLLVFDGGTGLRYLGEKLARSGPRLIDLFLSHTHHDHVVGLPFFKPFFEKGFHVRMWSGHLDMAMTTHDALKALMTPPLFPIDPASFQANIEYRDFRAGDTLEPAPGITVNTAPLHHVNGATGFRVNYDGRSVCYVTDTEHDPAQMDRNILELVRGADIMVYDSTYTDDEFRQCRGWGHSTWEEGMRIAKRAGVRQFVAFHHDPSHDDTFMDRMASRIREQCRHSIVAREGLVLRPRREAPRLVRDRQG